MLDCAVAQPCKQQVAAAFSRAAQTYDSVADLQRAVGTRLLSLIPETTNVKLQDSTAVQHWLDLGCGTGHFCEQLQQRWPAAQGIGLDLASGMLTVARQRCPTLHYICADAEQLPLADNSQNLIFSSLALQWCSDFSRVLSEIKRVLKPGGILLFSSVAEGSLEELRNSWRAVDDAKHVNNFRPLSLYQDLAAASGLQVLDVHCHTHTYYYHKVRELTHELKHLGADHVQGRAQGLVGRQRLQRLLDAYENYRQPQGLPATWQVVYGVLSKEH
ncbi:MAG TPA: malonyl-ACP O-methyltransferase BioC [Thiopseudomonas sp.]|nr:malonyl-ACP O-methyltransferase BioC [Thiopseudomonas sp.]